MLNIFGGHGTPWLRLCLRLGLFAAMQNLRWQLDILLLFMIDCDFS